MIVRVVKSLIHSPQNVPHGGDTLMKLKLTEEQVFDLASKIFDEVNNAECLAELKDQNGFVRSDWIRTAHDAIEGYNDVAKYVDFPGVTIVKNCCRICKHVDLYRPACNLRGDDIALECVCSKFELFEFEDDDRSESDNETYWDQVIRSRIINERHPFRSIAMG